MLLNCGQTGVACFLVLSGFVLVWSARLDLPTRAFYRRRFARIYPAYLVMIVVGATVAVRWPGSYLSGSRWDLLAALVLVQSWVPERVAKGAPFSFNPLSWSLSCEAFFYALLPFSLRRLKQLPSHCRAALAGGLLVVAIATSSCLSVLGWGATAYAFPAVASG